MFLYHANVVIEILRVLNLRDRSNYTDRVSELSQLRGGRRTDYSIKIAYEERSQFPKTRMVRIER